MTYLQSMVARKKSARSEVERAQVEHWLREDVVPAYDRAVVAPDSCRTVEQVRESLRQHRLKKGKAAAE